MSDYLQAPPDRLPVWHLVGGLDPLDHADLDGSEPDDGYPVLLRDWIARDGLRCLKVKLRGNDQAWDEARLRRVGEIAAETGVAWLSADFNCTVTAPAYVNEILDRLAREQPALFDRLLYVEQPFPYDLEAHRIDVRSVAARKPLFMDESAHDWRLVRLGRELGWTGVALKTCKTQTGALLSLCWAQRPRHGADGAGFDQSDAGADSPRVAGGPRGHHHGRRVQRHAVLPRGIGARSPGASGAIRAARGCAGPVLHSRRRLWLSPGRDRPHLAAGGYRRTASYKPAGDPEVARWCV